MLPCWSAANGYALRSKIRCQRKQHERVIRPIVEFIERSAADEIQLQHGLGRRAEAQTRGDLRGRLTVATGIEVDQVPSRSDGKPAGGQRGNPSGAELANSIDVPAELSIR